MEHIITACWSEELHPLLPYVTTILCVAGAAVLGKSIFRHVQRRRAQSAGAARRARQRKGVVYLFGLPRSATCSQTSAPTGVVETYLRAANVPYVLVTTTDFSVSPTGRFPYIELNGTGTPESHFIMERIHAEFPKLVAENINPLNESDTALATFVQRMVSGSLRNGLVRQLVVDNLPVVTRRFAELAPPMPRLLLKIAMRDFRNNFISMLNQEGYGDLSDAEYLSELQRDLSAIETLLRTRSAPGRFALGGTKPTVVDAYLYGWLHVIASYPLEPFEPTRIGATARFTAQVRDTLYPDMSILCGSPCVGHNVPPKAFNGAVV